MDHLKQVKQVSILFGGILELGEAIRLTLKDDYSNCSINFDFANTDSTLWTPNEVIEAAGKFSYDLFIILLNNLLLPNIDLVSGFETRMGKVASLIKELCANKNAKVVGLYGPDDNFWPQHAIQAGAKVVYQIPLSLKRFSDDFPAIMGWENEQGLERIVPKYSFC